MRLFCDMDGVLVNQTSRKRFDLMSWMPGGRELWAFLAPFKPTILSQLKQDIWGISIHEKRAWCARELGADVPVIVVHAEVGKSGHSAPGHVLIDDSEHHRDPWNERGGIFIRHTSARETIASMNALMRLVAILPAGCASRTEAHVEGVLA